MLSPSRRQCFFLTALHSRAEIITEEGSVRGGAASVPAANSPLDEIGLRLYEIPAFRKIAQQIGMQIARNMARAPTP